MPRTHNMLHVPFVTGDKTDQQRRGVSLHEGNSAVGIGAWTVGIHASNDTLGPTRIRSWPSELCRRLARTPRLTKNIASRCGAETCVERHGKRWLPPSAREEDRMGGCGIVRYGHCWALPWAVRRHCVDLIARSVADRFWCGDCLAASTLLLSPRVAQASSLRLMIRSVLVTRGSGRSVLPLDALAVLKRSCLRNYDHKTKKRQMWWRYARKAKHGWSVGTSPFCVPTRPISDYMSSEEPPEYINLLSVNFIRLSIAMIERRRESKGTL